jgi:AAA domain, putative AbiEii toxin, Type IV TA system
LFSESLHGLLLPSLEKGNSKPQSDLALSIALALQKFSFGKAYQQQIASYTTKNSQGDLKITQHVDKGSPHEVETLSIESETSSGKLSLNSKDDFLENLIEEVRQRQVTDQIEKKQFDRVTNHAVDAYKKIYPFLKSLPSVTRFEFDTFVLYKPAAIDEPSELKEDGSNLGHVLSEMKLNETDKFDELREKLKQIIPHVKDLKFPAETVTTYREEQMQISGAEPFTRRVKDVKPARRIALDFDNAPGIDGDAISEGTLLVLAILAAVYSHPNNATLLFDDIDRGLHPKAQAGLVKVLRELMTQRPGLQIIATTHSPYLLDEFQHNEVRMSTIGEDGFSAWAEMTKHPAYEKWKEMMTPGEFWTHIGEDWIKELPRNKQKEKQHV